MTDLKKDWPRLLLRAAECALRCIFSPATAASIGAAALEPVQKSMGDPLETKTITLSCGKLTTGVTVKPWTGIFMLRNLCSKSLGRD